MEGRFTVIYYQLSLSCIPKFTLWSRVAFDWPIRIKKLLFLVFCTKHYCISWYTYWINFCRMCLPPLNIPNFGTASGLRYKRWKLSFDGIKEKESVSKCAEHILIEDNLIRFDILWRLHILTHFLRRTGFFGILKNIHIPYTHISRASI